MKRMIGSKKVLYMRNDAEAAEFVSKHYGEYHNKEDFKILYVKQLDKKVYGINCHEVFYEYNVYEKSDRIVRERTREIINVEHAKDRKDAYKQVKEALEKYGEDGYGDYNKEEVIVSDAEYLGDDKYEVEASFCQPKELEGKKLTYGI